MLGKGKYICVKIFESNTTARDLEDRVNRWLQAEAKDLEIQDIKYSSADGTHSVLVIIPPDSK